MPLQSLFRLLNNLPLPTPQRSVDLAARTFGASAVITAEDYQGPMVTAEKGVKLEGDAAAFLEAISTLYPGGVVAVDTESHPQLRNCPHKTGAIRFIAGVPLLSSEGLCIGALWIVDREPRAGFSGAEMTIMRDFAAVISLSMELPILASHAFEAEIAVKASEARFHLLADCASCLIWRIGPDGEVQFLNKTLREYYGIGLDEMEAYDWAKNLHPDNQGSKGTFFAAFNRRGPCHEEVRIRRADGVYRWFAVDATPAFREDGQFTGYVGVMTDISEQKSREEFMGRDLVRLAQIVESSYDAIIASDSDGRITTWNAAAERLFGYPAAEAIGQRFTLLSPPGSRDEMDTIFRQNQQGTIGQHYEAVRQHKDGSVVPVSVRLSPIHDDNGQGVGLSAIYRPSSLDLSQARP